MTTTARDWRTSRVEWRPLSARSWPARAVGLLLLVNIVLAIRYLS